MEIAGSSSASDASATMGPKQVAENVRATYDNEDDFEMTEGAVAKKWQGTAADRRDMSALGRVQELRRNFQFLGILGFACTLIATWEVIVTTLGTSLTDGGTAGLLWGFIIVFIGFSFVYLSVAEMVSMAPTSGGQYHWVSEFAPPASQKILSYIVGWLCFTGWQCAITSITFLAGSTIQGLIILNDPTYVPKQWHATLLIIALTVFSIFFNTVLAKKLPLVEGLLLVLHVLGLFAIIITLWVLAPRADAYTVWTEFTNGGNWNSDGTATLVGLAAPIISLIGFDCAVHMSEEVKDASSTLPKAMLWSFGFNASLGFIMAVTICFTVGNVSEVLNSATASPIIQIFFNTTQSYAGASILTVIIILTLTSAAIAEVATASRQLWSFARDKGIPGHRLIGHITPKSNIPLNAVLVSLTVTSLLSLINIGSTTALNAILALTVVSLLCSYMIVISLVILRRVRGQSLPSRRFNLGRLGLPINILAMCYLMPIFVFAFFPVTSTVTPESMNWAIVMFGGIMGFALVWYFIWGHKEYVPPVALVKRQEYED
ncbi:amino acid transporter-like protein [Hortaea werneckii]|nr:amino acid transporter-like protein [Hortaea werneckii]KAI7069653.1 amino acid transporter-like protein [Hortaea werneckii]KAI7209841.1 amino acid transporter-like protein [Hortaea werneckii]KAI7300245.1 amino acid transporter-like protein [Hortaea werneckii]KAI7383350.1 amino acid transporter-like protein [Hortaea werneckii]